MVSLVLLCSCFSTELSNGKKNSRKDKVKACLPQILRGPFLIFCPKYVACYMHVLSHSHYCYYIFSDIIIIIYLNKMYVSER